MIDAMLAVWRELIRERLVPRNAEVLETLAWYRKSEIKVGLLSNAGPEVPPAFASTELHGLVDEAVFSCQLGAAKPSLVTYRAICERLGVDPAQCIFVGDGGDDELEGARRAGMKAIWLRVHREIEAEGLPPTVTAWSGPVVTAFGEIREYVKT